MRTPDDEPTKSVDLDDVIATEAFRRRPARPPDYEAENRALVALAEALTEEPESVVDRLVALLLELCRADTAGVSILRRAPEGDEFVWVAIAGIFAPHVGGGTLADFSPCGVTIDRDEPVFIDRPSRFYRYLADVEPPVVEGLLVPFRAGGKPIGTVWIVSNDERRRFDPEDLRLVTRISTFASAALTRLSETAELRAARGRIDATLTAAEVGTWTWDVSNDMVIADRNLARIFGVAERDVSGGPIDAYIRRMHPDDREQTWKSIVAALDGPDDFAAEYRIVGEDGKVRWAAARGRVERDATGSPLRLPGIAVDITAAKERDLEVRRLAERMEQQYRVFDTALSFISDLVYIYDRDARFVYVNQSIVELFGLPLEKLIGKSPFDLGYPDELAERMLGQIRHVFATGEEVRDETPFTSPTGVVGYYEYIFRPVFAADGAVECVVGSTRDNTDRRLAEHERERLLERERDARTAAEEASRLKEEFLATVSHELRSPLSAILGWAAVLKNRSAAPGQAATAVDVIERSARTQARLIEDLLDVSRVVAGNLRLDVRTCGPSVFVDPAVDSLGPTAHAKGVEIVATVDADAPDVDVDPARLQQVVWNLLSNAIKFTPRDGRVHVEARRDGERLRITVEDSGCGIDAAFLPQVFDRFAQAERGSSRRHGGLGLGLSIVRNLVELHGGTVAAESDGEGRGARFTVGLPLSSASQPAPVRPLVGGAEALRLDGVRVLVVDDEADARSLLVEALGMRGAVVETAASAAEARAALAGRPTDVIVSDVGMPGEDGYAFLRGLREHAADPGGRTPAVALTAYTRSEDRLKALGAGYQAHLAKPVEIDELAAEIRRLTGLDAAET